MALRALAELVKKGSCTNSYVCLSKSVWTLSGLILIKGDTTIQGGQLSALPVQVVVL